jgi:hypothetical protein
MRFRWQSLIHRVTTTGLLIPSDSIIKLERIRRRHNIMFLVSPPQIEMKGLQRSDCSCSTRCRDQPILQNRSHCYEKCVSIVWIAKRETLRNQNDLEPGKDCPRDNMVHTSYKKFPLGQNKQTGLHFSIKKHGNFIETVQSVYGLLFSLRVAYHDVI